MRFERGQASLERWWEEVIISIEKDKVIATTCANASVPRDSGARIFLAKRDGLRMDGRNLMHVVGRAIVYHDAFKVLTGLRSDCAQCFIEQLSLAVRRDIRSDNDGDARCGA
jgi:hypothetical protein